MHIETVVLTNSRSFGPAGQLVELGSKITTLVGGNGTGKTVFIQALQRLFGIF